MSASSGSGGKEHEDALFKLAFIKDAKETSKLKGIKSEAVAGAIQKVLDRLSAIEDEKAVPPGVLPPHIGLWDYAAQLNQLVSKLNKGGAPAIGYNLEAIQTCANVRAGFARAEQEAEQARIAKERSDAAEVKIRRAERKQEAEAAEIEERRRAQAAVEAQRARTQQMVQTVITAHLPGAQVTLGGMQIGTAAIPQGKAVCVPHLNGVPQPQFAGVSQNNDFGCGADGNWIFNGTSNARLNTLGDTLTANRGIVRNPDGSVRPAFVCSEVDAALTIAVTGANWAAYKYLCVVDNGHGWEYIQRCPNCQSTFEEP